MAYAAALGDDLPCYMDTRSPAGVLAHPLFPVCFEWDVLTAARAKLYGPVLKADEAIRGVHATHDLIVHRPIRPPERLRTRMTVAAVERRNAGAYMVSRLDTEDASGAPVCTSWYGTLFRGVGVEGPDRPAADLPAQPAPSGSIGRPRAEIEVPVAAGLAHVYTECARIFNPIHTDAAVAARAGLPSIILHGTATLALAVSRIVVAEAGGDPARVGRVAGRFGGMVTMPSDLRLRIIARETVRGGAAVFFEMLNHEGKPAIRDGFVSLRG